MCGCAAGSARWPFGVLIVSVTGRDAKPCSVSSDGVGRLLFYCPHVLFENLGLFFYVNIENL
jgi:hypothetical protein